MKIILRAFSHCDLLLGTLGDFRDFWDFRVSTCLEGSAGPSLADTGRSLTGEIILYYTII